VPLRCEEGRPKAVRDKIAGKGQQKNYWTEAVQVTNTDNRPDLSSEGAPDIDKTVTVKQPWAPDGARHQGLADWSSVVTWLWLWMYSEERPTWLKSWSMTYIQITSVVPDKWQNKSEDLYPIIAYKTLLAVSFTMIHLKCLSKAVTSYMIRF
jgi:hypothetical protein